MKYKFTQVHADLWGIFPDSPRYFQHYMSEDTITPYSLRYWLYKASCLCKNVEQDEFTDRYDPQVAHFVAVYAAAMLDEDLAKNVNLNDYDDVYFNFQVYGRFNLRAELFARARGQSTSVFANTHINLGSKIIEYLNRGGISEAPNTEEEFIKWASNPLSDIKHLRKEYRLIRDLRDAYKTLLRSLEPYINEAGNKDKAEQLYKDFYNYTALEWLVELPY